MAVSIWKNASFARFTEYKYLNKWSMGAQNLHVNWHMKSKLNLLYAAQSI